MLLVAIDKGFETVINHNKNMNVHILVAIDNFVARKSVINRDKNMNVHGFGCD